MRNCLKCQTIIPLWIKVNGKSHNLSSRKYCLNCSPFKSKNTKKLHLPETLGQSKDYKNLTPEQKKAWNARCYQNQYISRQKRKIYLVKLLGGKCQSCGYDKNISVLSFHHRNPEEKRFTISTRDMANLSMEELEKEAKKCDLLCSNCHGEYHNPKGFEWQDKNEWKPLTNNSQYIKLDPAVKKSREIARRKVVRPEKEELEKLITEFSFVTLGRRFGVTGNTVRKWCKSYGLEFKKRKSARRESNPRSVFS